MSKYFQCPCSSKALYHKCCKQYHDGAPPENALVLMRSRYTAYALGLCDYIIATTHPEHPLHQDDVEDWRKDLRQFSQNTRFDSLKVLEFVDGDNEALVTFTAFLRQGDGDHSFTEKSVFETVDGRWMYKSGEIKSQD